MVTARASVAPECVEKKLLTLQGHRLGKLFT